MIAKYNKMYSPVYRDDFFNDLVPSKYYGKNYASTPAVNIMEEKDGYRIDVAAAGLSKKDFKINVEEDILTVSANKEQEEKENDKHYTRREFNFTSFSRRFVLDERIDQEGIKAEHVDGILKIHLPMKEESIKQGPKSIKIS